MSDRARTQATGYLASCLGSTRGPLDQQRLQLTDPGRDRISRIVPLAPAPGERLAQRGEQREKRDRLTQRIRCPGRQRKTPGLSHTLTLVQHKRLADALFPVD
jgi:hypothetical protein